LGYHASQPLKGLDVSSEQSQEQGPRGKGPRQGRHGKGDEEPIFASRGKRDKVSGNVKQAGENVKDALKK
jgi:hypothetical protein